MRRYINWYEICKLDGYRINCPGDSSYLCGAWGDESDFGGANSIYTTNLKGKLTIIQTDEASSLTLLKFCKCK